MTLVEPAKSSPHLVMGWVQDPRSVRHQVTHAAEPGHRVAACGVRVAFVGGAWAGLTSLGRCSVCRTAAAEIWGEAETGSSAAVRVRPHRL